MSHKGTEAHERNAALLDIIRKGNDAERRKARDDLIVANMPLVTVKVEAHLRRFRGQAHLRDDFLSEGLVGLIQGADRVGSIRGDKVSSYLGTSIVRAIRKYSLNSKAIHEPAGSRHRNEKKRLAAMAAGEPAERYDPPQIVSIAPGDETTEILDWTDVAYRDANEWLDHIRARCKTDEERGVVTLLAEEKSIKEIAEMLGIPYERVRYLREKVYQRLVDAGDLKSKPPRRQPRAKVAKRLAA